MQDARGTTSVPDRVLALLEHSSTQHLLSSLLDIDFVKLSKFTTQRLSSTSSTEFPRYNSSRPSTHETIHTPTVHASKSISPLQLHASSLSPNS
ncbi:hypothetical protein VDGE_30360 [Verticillium dahliae]|uniref:Uncharacterized protein n=1 Tax=Verticillium dahliae TaxID=27337 RepID=A0A444RSF5_VERDA|nr:hypothetical protein VDGE_30360 [Verticillium dahliae]